MSATPSRIGLSSDWIWQDRNRLIQENKDLRAELDMRRSGVIAALVVVGVVALGLGMMAGWWLRG